MSNIKFGLAIIKKRWLFKNIIIIDIGNNKKEYTESSYYNIIYKDGIHYDIIKKSVKPFEGYLKQVDYSIKEGKKYISYTMINSEGMPCKNNKVVEHSLIGKVSYELIKDEDNKYIFAWDTSMMTEKEASELTVAFLK